MENQTNYSAENIDVLEGLEAVRKRLMRYISVLLALKGFITS